MKSSVKLTLQFIRHTLLQFGALAAFAVAFVSPAKAVAETNLQIGVEHENYFARKEFLFGEVSYLNVHSRFRHYSASPSTRLGLDLGVIGAANVNDYYAPFAPEAFVQFRNGHETRPFEVTIGRKIEPWSRLDSIWKFGLYQPLFRWDYLRPEEQGLTGVFFALQTPGARFMLFATDLFIPEQGAPTRIKNEKVSSPSPWFSEPANEAILLSVATDIRYTLHTPPIPDIVLQPGVGTRISAGDPSSGFWSSGSAAWKPRNRISIPVTTDVPLTVISVNIYPQVEYHLLGAFDIGYAGQVTSFTFSSAAEIPINKKLDSELNRQKHDPTVFLSPMLEHKFSTGFMPQASASVALLHLEGGGSSEEGPISATGTDGNLFGYRFDWTNAVMFGLNAVFRDTVKHRIEGSARWMEEFRQLGSLVTLELRYMPVEALTVSVIGDFLGSRANKDNSTGLINKYRGNDRISAGVSYTF